MYEIGVNISAVSDSVVAYGTPTSPYLWVTPTTHVATELNETFTVGISISNVNNLHAFEFKLGYNTTLLDAVDIAQGPLFPTPPSSIITKFEINETTGQVWIGMSLSNSEASKSSSGTLITVSFTVTFAPSSSSGTWCVLDLHESMLYDDGMAQIPHDDIDGLYFWKTVLDDPSEIGLMLDLTTQRGGAGPNITDGTYILGEVVDLTGYLTYNGSPVENKFVSFEVWNPSNELVFIRVALTNENGYASISFQISALPESIGTWTVISIGFVSEQKVWDLTSFKVQWPVVGGYTTLIKEEHLPTLQMVYLTVFVATVLLATISARVQKNRKTILKLKH